MHYPFFNCGIAIGGVVQNGGPFYSSGASVKQEKWRLAGFFRDSQRRGLGAKIPPGQKENARERRWKAVARAAPSRMEWMSGQRPEEAR
jgi:hypothetical protein